MQLASILVGGKGRVVAVVLHGLYCLLGLMVVSRTLGPRAFGAGTAHALIAGWAIGLALHVPLVFSLNQLAGVALSPALLLATAAALVVLAGLAFRFPFPYASSGGGGLSRLRELARELAPSRSKTGTRPAEPWTVWAVAILSVAAVVFARRHGAMLTTPLQDWDSFLYHLPYGRAVAAGAFPADIAPDYAHVAAAYPPLFYFLQGLGFHVVDAVGGLDLTYWMPRATVTAVNAGLCVATWAWARGRLGLGREAAGWAVLWLVLLLNWKTNIQSVTALYYALALYFVWPADDARDARPGGSRTGSGAWVPGAILLAGCAWSNYTGVLLVATTLAVLWLAGFRAGAREQRDAALRMGLAVGVLLLPFLLRNALVAGNPVYPAALETLGGAGVTSWWLENEGVLRNAPVTRGTPSLAFHDARGAAPLLLAALGALLATTRVARGLRIAHAAIIVAFVGFWLVELQPTWAMAWRHLQPILPLAVGLAALPLDAVRRAGCPRSAFALFVWPLLLALDAAAPVGGVVLAAGVALSLALPALAPRMAAHIASITSLRRARLAIALGAGLVMTSAVDLDTISSRHAPGWVVAPWPEMAVPGLVAAIVWMGLARMRAARGDPSDGMTPGQVGVVIAALIVAGLVMLPRPIDPFGYRLDIRADIEWMNAHLPPRAVVLTLEDRLFTLERPYVQASNPVLEPFYVARDPALGFEELRRRGITHVYHTRSPIFRRQRFFFEKEMLFPGPDNPWVEIVHQSPTGAVVRLRRPPPS